MNAYLVKSAVQQIDTINRDQFDNKRSQAGNVALECTKAFE
jgi:hypothetical protein